MKNEGYYFLPPGGIYVSRKPTLIHTVLGSCVSVCIWDYKNSVGGMNHFIYHHAMSNARSCRYGDVAIPYLIKLMCRAGGNYENFRAHIVGGAQSLISGSIVGEENIKLAKDMMKMYNIKTETIDVGEKNFRKVIYNNLTGEITIKKG